MERLNGLILRLESELQSKGKINLREQQEKPSQSTLEKRESIFI